MTDAAMVALAIGEQYLAYWRRYCEAGWKAYAQKHGYDLYVLTEPLDRSERAAGRSPAWQKCLVLSQEFSAKYKQIISLDCDIVINANEAPSITAQTPVDRVGGVISGSHIHEDLRSVLMSRLLSRSLNYERGTRLWEELQKGAYQSVGLSPLDAVVQTGVLVASPQHHRELFEAVYAAPETHTSRCYEQIPLSHALLTQGLFHQIDTRFNCVFYEVMRVHYPFLLIKELPHYDLVASCAVQAEFANNFFLHFAYEREFAQFLGPQA
jgi:hypothetical protein